MVSDSVIEFEAKPLVSKLRLVARIISLGVIFLGMAVLVGWVFDVDILQSSLPGHIEMKANAALSFILAGVSLFFHIKQPVDRHKQRTARLLALFVALIGLLTLSEYLFNVDLGIDQLLFQEPPGAIGGLPPNRMGIPIASSMVLMGASLALLSASGRHHLAQVLALFAGLIGLLVLIGFAYGTKFFGIAKYTEMSINGAAGMFALSIGVLLAYPHQGFMAIITSDSSGGTVARRLLPIAIGVPILIGWFQITGERNRLYESAFGATLFTIVTVCILVMVCWRVARLVQLADDQRRQAETQALELAAEQEQMRALQQFVADVSHDFRTPLSILVTSSYLLRKHPDPERRQDHLAQIEKQTARLKKLLDDLLEMADLDNPVQPPDFTLTDMNVLVQEVIDELRKAAAAKDLHLLFEPAVSPLMVQANRLLQRAISNIVGNALHYTPEKGFVTVRTYADLPYIMIEVQDTGIGISDADLPHIFGRFYRTDKARRIETGGSGLGLAITKKIIEGHHGTIEVSSVLGEGSIFRVKLPASSRQLR